MGWHVVMMIGAWSRVAAEGLLWIAGEGLLGLKEEEIVKWPMAG